MRKDLNQKWCEFHDARISDSNEIYKVNASNPSEIEKVQVLSFYNSHLKQIPSNLYENFPQITKFLCYKCRLRRLENKFFKSPKLTTVILNSNLLCRLEGVNFKETPNLRQLNLAMNEIAVIGSEVFKSLPNLMGLYLHANKLSHLNAGIFDNLVNLELLFLSHNQLEVIPEGLFTKLEKLQILTLQENSIFSVSADFPSALPNLQNLTFTCNQCEKRDFNRNLERSWIDRGKAVFTRFFSEEKVVSLNNETLKNCVTKSQRNSIETLIERKISCYRADFLYLSHDLKGIFDDFAEPMNLMKTRLTLFVALTFTACVMTCVVLFLNIVVLVKYWTADDFMDYY